MAANSVRPDMVPSAPVNGGMRWRTYYHDLYERFKGSASFVFDAPAESTDGEAEQPNKPAGRESLAILKPCVAGVPPEEARVGKLYVYQARATDGFVDGFTWYLEKSPHGMVVERHTGEISWTPSEGGYAEVILCARSQYGSVGSQSWSICVHKAPARRPFVANPRFLAALRRKANRSAGGTSPFVFTLHIRGGSQSHSHTRYDCHSSCRPSLRAPPSPAWRNRVSLPLRL